ncbi:tetratricopeptide repeat protein [Flavobacteriales bacterium]|nr:tetratricopeptide repeat protein [Flavobacteriales bacterium]
MKKACLLISIVFLFSCKSEKTPDTNPQELVDAIEIESSVNNELMNIESFIVQNPNSEEGYYKRAKYRLENNELEGAFLDINKAMKIAPKNPDINLIKGLVYINKGELDKGIPFLERTIELDSLHTEGNLELAYYYLAAKNYDLSFTLINKIIQKDKFLAKPYYLKGLWYDQKGNDKLAISSYQTAVERNPNYYEAYLALGTIFDKNNNPLALQYFNSAIAVWPISIEAWRAKGMSYYDHNDFEEAMICFDTILSIDSTFEVSYFDMGRTLIDLCYEDNSKSKNDSLLIEAINNFDKALLINENYVPARYNRALCMEEQGKVNLALEEYRAILKSEPNYEPAIKALNRLGR